jgi:hypothetical protein
MKKNNGKENKSSPTPQPRKTIRISGCQLLILIPILIFLIAAVVGYLQPEPKFQEIPQRYDTGLPPDTQKHDIIVHPYKMDSLENAMEEYLDRRPQD